MRKILPLLFLTLLSGCFPKTEYEKTILLMGTTVNIKVLSKTNPKEAIRKAVNKMKEVSEKFDRFNKNSEISKINRNNEKSAKGGSAYGGKKIKISEDLCNVIDKSFYINKKTGGAFDITVGPLMELWGMYNKNISSMPDDEKINEVKSLVGMNHMKLDKNSRTLEFDNPHIKLDLNAIAKGYVVDSAISVLKDNGINSAIVEAGGDMFCLGDNKKDAWDIGIRHPKKRESIIAKIKVKNKAVTTSGGYENFLDINKKVYPHIIDPRTGAPVQTKTLSVTIIASECAIADGFATALFVMEPEQALELAENTENVDCIIICKENGKLRFLISSNITEGIEIK